MRPALNWGIQYKTLVVEAPGDKSKLLRKDLEIVYPGAVYNGLGKRSSQPVHVVVPELMGNIQCRILSSDDTGLMGFLERFIPPFTSPDPETRDQQAYGLCAFIGIHNYRLVVDYLGGCPGLTFISTEPGVCYEYFSLLHIDNLFLDFKNRHKQARHTPGWRHWLHPDLN